MELITLEEVRASVPTKLQSVVSQSLVDKLNYLNSEVPEAAENIRDNFITYVDVLQEGKYKLTDYLNAIKYISFQLMGKSNRESFRLTFPDRFKRMQESGKPMKDIDSQVSSYNRNILVNKIREKTIIPSWILNQDAYQEAINTQVRLMRTASSERVQAMAADSILNHLKRPENIQQAQLNINVNTGNILDELQKNMLKLAESQQGMIKLGVSTKDIAEQRIVVDVEPEEVS